MTVYTAKIVWTLEKADDFPSGHYGRSHSIAFDGGATIRASASPNVVGKWADPEAIDPEEMLVAALSSCHMLTFLHIARLAGFCVNSYRDRAEGVMAEIAPGRQAVTQVSLRPAIEWSGTAPDADRISRLHEDAHASCFVANSVKTEVTVDGPLEAASGR